MSGVTYRTRESVEAIQFTGENASAVYRFAGREVSGDRVRIANKSGALRGLTTVPDLHTGDWLVRRPKPLHKHEEFNGPGSLVVYSDEDFRATYGADDTAALVEAVRRYLDAFERPIREYAQALGDLRAALAAYRERNP